MARFASIAIRTTRAAVLERIGRPLVLRAVRLPRRLHPHEVLVKVSHAGVCGSDASVLTGSRIHRLPLIAGHEGSGRVVQRGRAVRVVQVGDRVAFNWQPHCGRCFYCSRGVENLCPTFSEKVTQQTARFFNGRGDPIFSYSNVGCFADHVVLHESCLVPIPVGVAMADAALIGCAVATGIGAVTSIARLLRRAAVLVAGAGGVGLNAIFAARRAGARLVIAVDKFRRKRRLAEGFGATHFLTPGDGAAARIRQLTEGRGVDVAIEAAGRTEMQELTLKALRPGGTAVWVGLPGSRDTLQVPARLIPGNDVTVRGALYGSGTPRLHIARLLREAKRGSLPLRQLKSRTYPLEDINEAFDDLRNGRVARGLIEFS